MLLIVSEPFLGQRVYSFLVIFHCYKNRNLNMSELKTEDGKEYGGDTTDRF